MNAKDTTIMGQAEDSGDQSYARIHWSVSGRFTGDVVALQES